MITGVSYSFCTKTLWVTASSKVPTIFDPVSGIDVTEYLAQDYKLEEHMTDQKANIKYFTYIPEQKMMIGVTSARTVIQWKYNEFSCVSVMRGHHDNIDCLACSKLFKVFALIGAHFLQKQPRPSRFKSSAPADWTASSSGRSISCRRSSTITRHCRPSPPHGKHART